MSGSESDSDFDSDIEEAAEKEISLLLLPEKSKEKYQRVYDNFKKWCRDKNFSAIDGEVIVEYFSTELRFLKATTSWSIYSQLRLTLMINDNFDISTIKNLRDLLKSRSVGHNAKKSRTFNKEEFYRFIKEAPDDDYLAMKVLLIVGVYGECRRDELTKMKMEDFEFMEDGIKVTLPFNTKTKLRRQFLINEGEDSEVDLIEIVNKNGKCIRLPIGINTIGGVPQKIASFLKLPFPNEFTGHCFKRTSASLLKGSTALQNWYTLHCGTPSRDGLVKAPSVYTISAVSDVSNKIDYQHNDAENVAAECNTNEHICTIDCGQVKCAMPENEQSVLHAFNLMKPPDYAVTEVMPALFTSDPTCRWIVGYKHNTGPVSPFNTNDTFKRITRSIPNNVRIVQTYIRMESSRFSAAYVVEYGVNCTCQDQAQSSEMISSIEMKEIKCEF